jgi:hypothetical protein
MTEDSGRGRLYGYFALTAGDTAELRARRASGTDADVLAWAKQLAVGPANRVAGDNRAWEPLRASRSSAGATMTCGCSTSGR